MTVGSQNTRDKNVPYSGLFIYVQNEEQPSAPIWTSVVKQDNNVVYVDYG